MALRLSILGCNSAKPSISRFTTAQVLHAETKNYVIDCGEGIQIRLKQLKIKSSKIDQIFISHLHGDHFFGLPGLINSLNLNGRIKPLMIFGPVGLQKFIDSLMSLGALYLNFELNITELNANISDKIFEDDIIEVISFPLKHRVPTTGFLFREKSKERKLIKSFIREKGLTIDEIKSLKGGANVLREDGTLLEVRLLTHKPTPGRSYAFCSDTIYDEDIIKYIEQVDTLYHESTYLEDLKDKAHERGHSTAGEAALIAKKAGAKKLILGHYSSRYKDIRNFEMEAQKIFSNVELAEDGKVFSI